MNVKESWQQQMKMLKGKTRKQKIAWFFDYYKWAVIGVAAAVAVVISIIHTAVTNKEAVFGITMINASGNAVTTSGTSTDEWLKKPLAEYLGIDLDKYDITTDTSEYMSVGTISDSMELASQQKMIVYIAAQEVDVMLADAWYFENYAMQSTFMDLRDVMTEEELAKYKGKILYIDQAVIDKNSEISSESATKETTTGTIADITDNTKAMEAEKDGTFELPDPDTMENPVPVGIVMTGSKIVQDNMLYPGTVCIAGIVSNSKHTDSAVKCLEFLYGE